MERSDEEVSHDAPHMTFCFGVRRLLGTLIGGLSTINFRGLSLRIIVMVWVMVSVWVMVRLMCCYYQGNF